ncbi:MAG: HAD family hydrolase [Alphaproteobacteria bacterium]|jgi:phosphoglycolate phosphatase
MKIRGILFDKDGTLLDYHATWVPTNRAAARIVAKGDAALAFELLRIGGQDDRAGTVAPGSLLAAGTTEEVAARWTRYLPPPGFANLPRLLDDIFQREGAKNTTPVPGLADTLVRLKARGLTLGVATSDSEAGARSTIAPFQMLDHFDFVAGFDSGFGTKPEPGMVLAFCRAIGLSPGEVLVVGDNHHDLEMARRAGAGLAIGVLTGTSRRTDLTGLADHVLDSIVGIEDLLFCSVSVERPRR